MRPVSHDLLWEVFWQSKSPRSKSQTVAWTLKKYVIVRNNGLICFFSLISLSNLKTGGVANREFPKPGSQKNTQFSFLLLLLLFSLFKRRTPNKGRYFHWIPIHVLHFWAPLPFLSPFQAIHLQSHFLTLFRGEKKRGGKVESKSIICIDGQMPLRKGEEKCMNFTFQCRSWKMVCTSSQ